MIEISLKESLLFYAISYECKHKGEASLEGIFSAEDAINRSAKTFDELKFGLDLLLSIDLIQKSKQNFKITTSGRGVLGKVVGEEETVFQSLNKLTELLKTQFSHVKLGDYASLNQSDYSNAYKSHYSGI